MRLDLSTSDWHKLLKPVLPHAATGKLAESQPHLGRVRLELRAICAGNRYLHRVQAYANGTHVLTVKRARSA